PASDPYFNDQNMLIDDRLTAVNTIRVGGEYRWRQLRFRGGYQYEEGPFKNKDLMSDLTGFSLGLGYNFGSTNIDFAYMRTEQKRNHELLGGAFTNTANINNVNEIFLLTLGFSL
ncbi:MAG TPA: transporter, partial [Flavobacteriaceae bacterium]|nr:transporter [Flavobacteriaceae bacterium]